MAGIVDNVIAGVPIKYRNFQVPEAAEDAVLLQDLPRHYDPEQPLDFQACQLSCGHIFLFYTVSRVLLDGNRLCPICRKTINRICVRDEHYPALSVSERIVEYFGKYFYVLGNFCVRGRNLIRRSFLGRIIMHIPSQHTRFLVAAGIAICLFFCIMFSGVYIAAAAGGVHTFYTLLTLGWKCYLPIEKVIYFTTSFFALIIPELFMFSFVTN